MDLDLTVLGGSVGAAAALSRRRRVRGGGSPAHRENAIPAWFGSGFGRRGRGDDGELVWVLGATRKHDGGSYGGEGRNGLRRRAKLRERERDRGGGKGRDIAHPASDLQERASVERRQQSSGSTTAPSSSSPNGGGG